MALVNTIKKNTLETSSKHKPVECTFSKVEKDGEKFLQIDTYGSKERKLKGKKSQTIRFTPKAIKSLKDILENL